MNFELKLHFYFLLILSFLISQGQGNDVMAKANFLKAEESFGNGRFAESIEYLDKVKQMLDGTNPRVEQLRARCYFELGDGYALQSSLASYFTMASESDIYYSQMLMLLTEVDRLKEVQASQMVKAQQEMPDREAWKQAQITNTSSAYQKYLISFPNGLFVKEADERLKILPPTEVIDSRDGRIYNVVKIGEQVWMAENLAVSKFLNGDIIPQATSKEEWKQFAQAGKPAWCYYNFDQAHASEYGYLYNWFAVIDSRGLSPKGWRIPTDGDWTYLNDFLGGAEAGTKMKGLDGWVSSKKNTNSCGFEGIAGGICLPNGVFQYQGIVGFWWSSTEHRADNAYFRSLGDYSILFKSYYNKGTGQSVRCIRTN